jgi:hypothetical protein
MDRRRRERDRPSVSDVCRACAKSDEQRGTGALTATKPLRRSCARAPEGSCAGLLLAARTPLPKVAAILRHSDTRITAEVYAGLVESERTQLGSDLAAAFADGR